MTQAELAERAGMNRAMIIRLEQEDYMPSIEQLESLCNVLDVPIASLFEQKEQEHVRPVQGGSRKIAVAGAGYVGLSVAVLLAQHNTVTVTMNTPSKAEMINRGESPIRDRELEEYLPQVLNNLSATTDKEAAYREAEFVIVAAPTNYDPARGYFDTSAVEDVLETVARANPSATVVIKSTVRSVIPLR